LILETIKNVAFEEINEVMR